MPSRRLPAWEAGASRWRRVYFCLTSRQRVRESRVDPPPSAPEAGASEIRDRSGLRLFWRLVDRSGLPVAAGLGRPPHRLPVLQIHALSIPSKLHMFVAVSRVRRIFLLRQRQLSLDVEVLHQYVRSAGRLPAANGDPILPRGYNWLPSFGHHAHVAWLEFEPHLLRRARLQMNPLEGPQCPQRRARKIRKAEIELGNFIACALACIGHCDLGNHGAARFDGARWDGESAVAEGGVTQSVPEGIERLPLKVAVGAARHCVIGEGRQLAYTGIEGHGQTATWIVAPGERVGDGCSAFLAGVPGLEDGVGLRPSHKS